MALAKKNVDSATRSLHDVGQSLWLDNITRTILIDGSLRRYIDDLSVTGLTSNPTIFDHAIKRSHEYDDAIRQAGTECASNESLFYRLALQDLTQAADLFRPVHEATGGEDGWVSLEVSPRLADDRRASVDAAVQLHGLAQRPNLFIKIPGTVAGIGAIEDAIFAGVPINVTLLFSRDQYLSAAEAYMRGIERRIAAGIDPQVRSVASLFVSRWDVAAKDHVPASLHNRLGIAVAKQVYQSYRELLQSPRWRALRERGAVPQRLLWASTGTKDPAASDTLYVEALAAPDTINTLPEATLLAFADHGRVATLLAKDGGDSASVLAQFAAAGVDAEEMARKLQLAGTEAFITSWDDLLHGIAARRATPHDQHAE